MKNATLRLLVLAVILSAVPALATNYGKPLSDAPVVRISELLASPDDWVGKTVKVEGIITDVCSKRGCWMMIASDQEFQSLRFKVEDGVIVFPIEAKGRKAVAEGTFKRIELTKEQAVAQAKHHAEEHGLPFDPDSVTGPSVTYQLDGLGAVVE
jgi:hypothetical protein